MVIRIGTRGSELALWQARTLSETLRQTSASASKIVIIKKHSVWLVSNLRGDRGEDTIPRVRVERIG